MYNLVDQNFFAWAIIVKFNFVVNLSRQDAVQAAAQTAQWLREKQIQVGAEGEVARQIGVTEITFDEVGQADLVLAFGGDGTVIYAADCCSKYSTPILGVFYGRFGFVTKCSLDEVRTVISNFINSAVEYDERMMVQTDLIRDDRVVATIHSLNEAVLHREAEARILHFSIQVNQQYLTSFPADGVLVCTPTGSTAYSMSAGGPIVDPKCRALILTAINPHSLNTRSLVLHPESSVELRASEEGEAVLLCDGQKRIPMIAGDSVRITCSPRITRLIDVHSNDFLNKLKDRIF
jgi:NAD+ kinase